MFNGMPRPGDTFEINVTAEHFKKSEGYANIVTGCPLHIALKEKFPDNNISVGNRILFFDGIGFYIEGYVEPKECSHLINLAKNNVPVKTLTVRLTY